MDPQAHVTQTSEETHTSETTWSGYHMSSDVEKHVQQPPTTPSWVTPFIVTLVVVVIIIAIVLAVVYGSRNARQISAPKSGRGDAYPDIEPLSAPAGGRRFRYD